MSMFAVISPLQVISVTFVVVFSGIIYWWKEIHDLLTLRTKLIKFAATLPGPPTFPLIGNAFSFRNTDETADILSKWSREINKTYRVWLGPMLKIIITDPRDLEILLASPLAEEKDSVYDLMHSAIKDTLINGKGAKYRAHKKLMMPLVNGKPLPSYILECNKHTRRFIEILENKSGAGEFDMEHALAPCIGDVVFETLFGIPGTAQLGEENIVIYGVEKLLHILHQRMIKPWLHPEFIFKLSKDGREWFRVLPEMRKFLDDKIVEKKNRYFQLPNEDSEQEVPLTLADQLLDHIMKTKIWTDVELRDELATMFIGSHDTITAIGSFALLMLAMNPDMQRKVREEVELSVGEKIITDSDMVKLKYIDMVIRETIRLFPIGPFLPRKVTGDIKLATCTLPKGSSAFMMPYATHRDPDYWMEPEKFNPDRFTPENSKNRHKFAYVPFSGGIRACPGYKYAMTQLKVVVADVVRNYNLATTTTMETLKLTTHISVRSQDGCNMSITRIKS